MYHLDVYVSYTGFTVSPDEGIQRFSQVAFLVEPHLVLWRYHFLVPWVEYGTKVGLGTQRVSTGLSYYFYMRPWSVRMGMGVAYDDMFFTAISGVPPWRLFRVLTSLVFFL